MVIIRTFTVAVLSAVVGADARLEEAAAVAVLSVVTVTVAARLESSFVAASLLDIKAMEAEMTASSA